MLPLLPLAAEFHPLQVVWFILIAVLWIGYLILEGFDYGVGMLIPVLGKTEKERRVIVNTIGPVWDSNQVWLLTAGGATFAAFPGWYATLFSGAYIPLLLVLFALIIRGVSFEYRAKRPETKWRNAFDLMASTGSFLTALVFGIAFANMVIGLPLRMDERNPMLHIIDQSFWGYFSLFGILGGIVLVVAFLFHGANYLSLKTKGEFREKARAFSSTAGLAAIVVGAVFLLWSNLAYSAGMLGWIAMVVAALGLIGSWVAGRANRDGWAFIGSTVAVLFVAVGIFARIFPDIGFNNAAVPDMPLNITSAASTPYTLTIMTVAAGVFVPIVLLYTAWAYWVNRRRIGVANIPDEVPEGVAAY